LGEEGGSATSVYFGRSYVVRHQIKEVSSQISYHLTVSYLYFYHSLELAVRFFFFGIPKILYSKGGKWKIPTIGIQK
jgi:hypothetical protein